MVNSVLSETFLTKTYFIETIKTLPEVNFSDHVNSDLVFFPKTNLRRCTFPWTWFPIGHFSDLRSFRSNVFRQNKFRRLTFPYGTRFRQRVFPKYFLLKIEFFPSFRAPPFFFLLHYWSEPRFKRVNPESLLCRIYTCTRSSRRHWFR